MTESNSPKGGISYLLTAQKVECPNCGMLFSKVGFAQKYCSTSCRPEPSYGPRRVRKKHISRPELPNKVCPVCTTEFTPDRKNRKFCSKKCSVQNVACTSGHGAFADNVTTTMIGAVAELAISSDLYANGYHVYRSLTSNGPVDLIAVKEQNIRMIEVRTGWYTKYGVLSFSKDRSKQATEFAVFIHSDKTIHYIAIESI